MSSPVFTGLEKTSDRTGSIVSGRLQLWVTGDILYILSDCHEGKNFIKATIILLGSIKIHHSVD
jgi:hypothetical protein